MAASSLTSTPVGTGMARQGPRAPSWLQRSPQLIPRRNSPTRPQASPPLPHDSGKAVPACIWVFEHGSPSLKAQDDKVHGLRTHSDFPRRCPLLARGRGKESKCTTPVPRPITGSRLARPKSPACMFPSRRNGLAGEGGWPLWSVCSVPGSTDSNPPSVLDPHSRWLWEVRLVIHPRPSNR